MRTKSNLFASALAAAAGTRAYLGEDGLGAPYVGEIRPRLGLLLPNFARMATGCAVANFVAAGVCVPGGPDPPGVL